jgi:hypothetical protein
LLSQDTLLHCERRSLWADTKQPLSHILQPACRKTASRGCAPFCFVNKMFQHRIYQRAEQVYCNFFLLFISLRSVPFAADIKLGALSNGTLSSLVIPYSRSNSHAKVYPLLLEKDFDILVPSSMKTLFDEQN